MKFSAEGTEQRGEAVGRMGIADKVESLRRAVQYGLDHGKKNMIVDLDVLAVALDLTTLPDIPILKPPTVAELQVILDCPEKPEIVVQADGSIRAETYPPDEAFRSPEDRRWEALGDIKEAP